MDFSVLAEDLDMVMLRTSAANGNIYFFAGVFCWLDGCLRLEIIVGRLHRLKAFVTWGRLLWHLPYNWEKTMENLSWCSWKVPPPPHTHTVFFVYLAASLRAALIGLLISSHFCLNPQVTRQFSVSVSACYVGWAVFLSSSLQFYHTMHNGVAKLAFF